MNSTRIVPIVTTADLPATRAFYVDLLGFEVCFDHGAYLGVRAGGKGSPELGFMVPDDEAPEVFTGGGVCLAISVADADREHARLVAAGAEIVQPPTDRPWGARSFVLRDPNGVALYVSHPIPMAVEFESHVR